MSVKINENPEHGISLDYIKAVKAVSNNQSAARKGGISLDYITNITSAYGNRKGVRPTEVSTSAAMPSASAQTTPATDVISRLKALADQVNSTAKAVTEKQTAQRVPPQAKAITQRQPAARAQAAAEVANNTAKDTATSYNTTARQNRARPRNYVAQVANPAQDYEILNTSDAIKWRVENGTFDANQSVDWTTDTEGNAVSEALRQLIAEQKSKHEANKKPAAEKIALMEREMYAYRTRLESGMDKEQAYQYMLFNFYPEGNEPYKSAEDFKKQYDAALNAPDGSDDYDLLLKLEEALRSREGAERDMRAVGRYETPVLEVADYQQKALAGLSSCKDEMWDPSKNDNFKKSAASFMTGSSNYHADKEYKEDVKAFEDSLKNPIAYIEKYRDQIQDESGINAWTDGASLRNAGIATPEYMYFESQEALIYSYYAETQGREKADEYMQSIMHRLTERREKFRTENNGMEQIAAWAAENDFLAGVASIPTNLIGGITSTVGMISGEDDKQNGMYYISNVTDALRSGATSDDSKVGAFFANTAMSIGDNLLASAFGPYAAPAIMGATATGNAYNSAIQSGSSEEEARNYAVLTGLIEWGTEKIPFDRLIKLADSGVVFDKNNMKLAVKAILGQAATEAAEETVNSYASTLMDITVRGDNSEYKQYIQTLIEQGMTPEEAEKEANINFFLIQPLESAAAGLVSGGVMSTGYTAVNTVALNRINNNEVRTAAEKLLNGERLSVSEKKNLLASDTNDRKSFEEVTGVSTTGDYSTVSARLDAKAETNSKSKASQNTPEITNTYANILENARDVQERRYGADTVRSAALSANVLTDNKNTLLKGRVGSMGEGGVTLPTRKGETITTISRSDIAERRNGVVGGISQNISAQLDAVELISAATGVPVYLYDGEATPIKGNDGEVVNGFTHRDTETGIAEYIALDINSDAPLLYLLGHETFHAMGKDSEQKLTKYLSEYLDETLTIEQAADKLGECLCDPAFCEYLVNKNRPLAQRILNFIKNLIAKLKGQEIEQLNTAQKTLANALNEYMKNGDTSKYGANRQNEYMTVADTFARDVDAWDRDGRKTGGYIRVGTTSEVLQGIGMKAQELYFDKSKIRRILDTHEHMNIDLIKQVPQMLEDPIAVLESTAHPNRVVAVGELYDTEEKPIIAAVEMDLKGANKSEISKIISAYGKRNLGATFENDRLLYLDPDTKRTTTWFRLLRLQLPAEGINRSGYIGMITPAERDVNGNFSIGNDTKFGTAMQEAFKKAGITNEDDNNSFMYAGRRAETMNASTLNAARQMILDGTDSETVRQRTGWFKGMDDKWRFEIDDSKLQFESEGFYEDPETLGDYIKHDALFDAYPELADMPLRFEKLGDKHNGRYDHSAREVIINSKLLDDIPKLKRTLVHEIQHAVQQIEGFTRGASRVEWKENGVDSTKESAKSLYRRTAGEIEARDTASRIDYNADRRKKSRPDIDRNDVVFADNRRAAPKGYTDIGDGVQVKSVDGAKRANRNKKFAAERDLINRIARRTRTKVQYVSSLMQDGKQLTGGCYYHRSSGTMYLNVNSDKALTGAFYRGLLYHISENDTRFVQTTYNYLREFGKDAGWSGDVISQINEMLLKRTDTTRPLNAFEEVFADKVAEMFEDENFMRYVSRKNMTFLQKLWENIKNFIIRSLGGTYTPPADVINAKTAEEIIGKMSGIQVLVAEALDRVSHDRTRAAAQAAKTINKEATKLDGKYVEYNGEDYTESEWQDYETDKVEYKDVAVEDLRSTLSKMPDAILKTLARELEYDFESTTATGRKIEFAKNVLDTLKPDDVLSVPTIPYREGDISPLTSKEQKENVSALKKAGGSIKTVRKYGYQRISDGVTIYVTDPSKMPLSSAHRDNIAGAKSLAAALGFNSIGYYTGEIRNVDGKEVKTESKSLIGEDGTLYLNLNADSPYTSVVGAAWFENLRRTNTMTAVALVKAYDRYRKLINSKTDISQWIGKQLTNIKATNLFTGNTLFTQELSRLMHMSAPEILGTIESDPQFASLISRADMNLAEKIVDSIKRFFTKFGDTIARITGDTDRRAASALNIAQKNLLLAMRDAPIDGARAMRSEAQRAAEYRRIQKIEEEIERIDRLERERARRAQRERAERRREYYEELNRQEAENSFMSRSVDNENAESYNQSRGDNNGRRKGKVFKETREAFGRRARSGGLRIDKEIAKGIDAAYRDVSGLLSEKGKEARRERTRRLFERGTYRTDKEIAKGIDAVYRDVSGLLSEKAKRAERELRRLGIKGIVFSETLQFNNGEYTQIASGDSVAFPGEFIAIGISDDLNEMECIGHEAFHLWKSEKLRESYINVVLENLLPGRTFSELRKHIEDNHIEGKLDKNNPAHIDTVREELVAYISGMIHSGQDISGLCKNPDAVIEAWNNLVEEHVAKASDDNSFMSRGSGTPRKVPAAEVIESIERFEYDEDTLRSIASQIFSDSTDMTAEELYDTLPDIIETLLEENPSLTFEVGAHAERTGSSLGRGLDELFADNADAVEKAVSRFEQPDDTEDIEDLEAGSTPAPIINEDPDVRSGYQELRDKFGTIPQGEDVNSRGDVGVPSRTQKNKKVRQGVRTFMEAKATPDEVVGELEREILNGTFSYTPLSDKAANNYARDMVESDPEEALKEWDAVVRSTKPATKKQIALAENLIMEAAALGDTDTAVRLIAEVAAEGTRAGQMVQAFRMIKKLSPMGQLYSLQKAIDKLNRENENRGVKIELPNTELEDYAKTVTDLEDLQRRIAEIEKRLPNSNEKGRLHDELDNLRDEAEQKKKDAEQKLDDLKDNVADQMPKKWTDKFNAWRYLAMLGNPRTHIRNILGNAVFAPTVTLKSKLAAAMEAGIKKINPNFQRSQALTASKAVREFAAKDAMEYLQQLGEGGKYNASDAIRDRQKVFSEKNVVGRTINKAAAFNSAVLEAEDGIFLRKRYAYALAHYCAANRWNVKFLEANPQKLQQAREFAFHEAQRATYRDMNAFSQFLSQASNKLRDGKGFSRVAYWAMEGALPFKKTPANIIKRGVEYSPLGLLNTIMVDSVRLKRGDITGAEYINNLAAGMTGTMVLGLGYLLASLGVLRGRSKDDEDEFEELRGAQEWSVVIGDVSYTVDWLAPMSLPLFVGVELYDQTANTNDKMDMQDLLDSLTAIAEPIFSLSMMDGVSRILQSYSSEGAISDMFIAALQSYAGQLTPTVLGQIARTIDDTSRNAYYNDKTSWWSNTVMQPIRSTMSKIPGANQQLPAYVDAWGRTTEGTSTAGGRFLQNFISPGYWSIDNTTPVDEEIQKIYDATGNEDVLPNTAPKQFSYNGEIYYLSSEEYVNFAVDRGQTAYTIIEELINSKTYKTLSASEKADAVNKAYDIALDYAKGNTESGFDAESNKAIKAFNENGVEYSDYILFSVLCTGTSQSDAYKALNKMRYLTDDERSALWDTRGWKTSYKEYKAEH